MAEGFRSRQARKGLARCGSFRPACLTDADDDAMHPTHEVEVCPKGALWEAVRWTSPRPD